MLTGPALMKGVKRMNIVMVCPNQRAGFALCNPYAMNMNQKNRNFYSCGEFSHLARNCRNRGIRNRIGKCRRLEYGQNTRQSNLNGEGDLVVLD